ncbi:hypothetical protein CTEN210_00946 [Chaetoceros tenuissimus]|uniref:G-protein coupled receptors family 1 profile domain-containing protein n=1 Tax=Chaetoceros tenuissimus TaxID=426638 RepID=A0AAD3CE76_9STRA|nr:hypothetical protein CTEN210_00946 [Chaetoceros tenuissimus]
MSSIEVGWKVATSLQISSAATSFFASLALAVMIFRKKVDLIRKPFKRILFLISVADILQSIGIFLSPFVVPASHKFAYWGHGTKGSCSFVGLLFVMGSTWVPLYSATLAIYYYSKLHLKIRDDEFARRIEKWSHRFNITLVVVLNIIALATKAINPVSYGNLCSYSGTDLDNGDNETAEAINTVIFLLATVVIPILSLLVILCLLSRLLWDIILREKHLSSPVTNTVNSLVPQNQQQEEQELGFDSNHSQIRDGAMTRQELAASYKKEMISQLVLYSLAYTVTYLPWAAINIMFTLNQTPSDILIFIVQMFAPLEGLFNILIITRPARRVVRTKSPHLGRWKAFWIVLSNGGDAPTQTHASTVVDQVKSRDISLEEHRNKTLVMNNLKKKKNSSHESEKCLQSIDSNSYLFAHAGSNLEESSEINCQDWSNIERQSGDDIDLSRFYSEVQKV